MDRSREEFEASWLEHRDYLWRVAWLICGDADVADDALGAAAARCWRSWAKTPVVDPAAYWRRAVVNEVTDRFRHRGRERRWRQRRTGEGRGQRELQDDIADRALIAEALDRLPSGQRAVIVLRYWADLTEQDTAETLEISVGTVKSRISRALDALALELSGTDLRNETAEASDV